MALKWPGIRSRRSKEFRLDAPEFCQFDGRGLRLAALIRAPGLEHGFFSIPIPGEPKARVRLRIHRPLDFGFFPSVAAVDGPPLPCGLHPPPDHAKPLIS